MDILVFIDDLGAKIINIINMPFEVQLQYIINLTLAILSFILISFLILVFINIVYTLTFGNYKKKKFAIKQEIYKLKGVKW